MYVSLFLVCIIFFGTARNAVSQQIIAFCEEPNGWRYDVEASELDKLRLRVEEGYNLPVEAGADGYTKMNPIYMWEGEQPVAVTSIWGATVVPGMTRDQVEAIVPTDTRELPVVKSSDEQIVAIDVGSNGIWVHSIYKSLGWVTVSRQQIGKDIFSNKILAVGALYQFHCTFGNTPE